MDTDDDNTKALRHDFEAVILATKAGVLKVFDRCENGRYQVTVLQHLWEGYVMRDQQLSCVAPKKPSSIKQRKKNND